MPRKKSDLGRRSRGAKAKRKINLNRTEEERASVNERTRQRVAQIRADETAEQRAARLRDGRLRTRRLRSLAIDKLRFGKNGLRCNPVLYDQELLPLEEVSIKIEENDDYTNEDCELVDYEVIIKDEPLGIIDADEQSRDMSDDCGVYNGNDDRSDFGDEDYLPPNLATTKKRVANYAGVNRVPKYQEDFSIAEGDSERITKRVKCGARKKAKSTLAKYAERVLCKECGKICSITTIKRHMMLHKNPKAFQCDICDYVGIQRYGHRKRYHEKLNEPLACQECDSVHYNLHDFKEHLKIHDQKYQIQALNISSTDVCHICGKPYFFADTFAEHILPHDVSSDNWCKHCQKDFSSSSNYKREMIIYTREKPYACSYCSKRFAVKGYLKTHVKTHENKHEYKCEICAKTYNIKQSLDAHRRLHADEKQAFTATSAKYVTNVSCLDATSKWAKSPKPLRTYTRQKVSLAMASVSDEGISDAIKEELSA